MKGPPHDDLTLSRGSKIEEADRLLPVVRRADDFVADKSSGNVEEREEFPEHFDTYLHTELNWSRLEYDGGDSRVSGWVFWNRQDDITKTLPISDFENVVVFPDSRPKLEDKIRLALGRIILHPQYGQSLVQFWAPSRTVEGRTLLSAQNQPFGLGKMGRSAWGLCEYRIKSMDYKFYGDIGERGEEELGLLGRVFLYKLPESTPDVQYYSLKEYPQLHDASLCQVKASWALPVFEHSSQVCVGVLELVSAVDAVADWYDESFLHNLCDVFKELGLQSSDVHKHYEIKYKDEDKEALTTAFHELTLVLESVYEIHKLPLALTWVPCNACDALLPGLSSNGGEYLQSFKANDNHIVESLIASTGYHLRKGHVAKMVLGSTSMLYCSDVTQFNIAEYPLVPFARQFKLSGCFTVCLRSSYTGEHVYMLEFFLPASSKDNENTLTQVSTILGTMKENSRTFKLASGKELGEVLSVEIFDFHNGQRHQYPQMIQASLEHLKNGDDEMDVIHAEQDDTVAAISKGGTTTQERERKKSGVRFDISLEDVLRFSALSSNDAAKRLKVSASTLKRVCRKYGIHRWPPCDLNKKEEVFPLALPNFEDIERLDSPEEMEVDATKYGPHDVRTESKSGVRSDISLEDVLRFSALSRKDAAKRLKVSESMMKRVCRKYGIYRWPPRDLNKKEEVFPLALPNFEDIGRLDSPEEMEVDATKYGPHNVRTESKSGVRFDISLEDVLRFSALSLKDAAKRLKVSESMMKRVCRKYGIHRWPPRDLNKEEVFPLALPNVEDIGNLDSPEKLEVDAAKYGPHDVRTKPTDHSWPSSSHLENKSLVMIENLQQHFGQRCEDVVRSLGVSVSTMKRICRQHGIKQWPYRQNGGGAMKQLDSDQPSMDALNNGRSFISAKRSNLDATFSGEGSIMTKERKKGETGVKIEIPLEVVLQYSNMRPVDAARKLKVSLSTLKRVCRHYGIHRWPPRNIDIDYVGAPQPSHDVPPCNLDKVGAPQPSLVELTSDRRPPPNRNKVGAPGPSHVEHQDGSLQLASDMPSNQAPLRDEGILQLTLDRPSNQVLDGVAHVKPRDTTIQYAITVKYVYGYPVNFQLPLGSGLGELHQQIRERLNLTHDAYDITYEDEDGVLILMACDDDLLLGIETSRSRSSSKTKKSIVVMLRVKDKKSTQS